MNGFSLPRVALPATLRLTAGERRRGQIYVMERALPHTGPETPLEMLNRVDSFFPFRPAGLHIGVAALSFSSRVSLGPRTRA